MPDLTKIKIIKVSLAIITSHNMSANREHHYTDTKIQIQSPRCLFYLFVLSIKRQSWKQVIKNTKNIVQIDHIDI